MKEILYDVKDKSNLEDYIKKNEKSQKKSHNKIGKKINSNNKIGQISSNKYIFRIITISLVISIILSLGITIIISKLYNKNQIPESLTGDNLIAFNLILNGKKYINDTSLIRIDSGCLTNDKNCGFFYLSIGNENEFEESKFYMIYIDKGILYVKSEEELVNISSNESLIIFKEGARDKNSLNYNIINQKLQEVYLQSSN